MFIGETFFPPESLNAKPLGADSIFQLLLMGIAMIGLGLAWKWELMGGFISLLAYVVLAILNPGFRHLSLLLIYPVSSVSFIILWAISRNSNRKK
jgi:hypothetical protein